jgi:hypothetical protein
LDEIEKQECFLIKPLEILNFLYPKSFLCINSLCSKHDNKGSLNFNLKNKEENNEKLNDEKKNLPTCQICISKLFRLNQEKQNCVDNILELRRIFERRNDFLMSLSQNTSFLIIDLRKKKSFTGVLLKSHLINPKSIDKIIEEIINDFIEMKSKFHFSFLISEDANESHNNIEIYSKKNERCTTQQEESGSEII